MSTSVAGQSSPQVSYVFHLKPLPNPTRSDPNLHVGEIGIPEQFARQLTYPEPVNPHNIDLLRQMVVNGCEKHPGANFVSDADGRRINLEKRTRRQRVAISKTLLAGDNVASGSIRDKTVLTGTQIKQKIVGRHLMNGDFPPPDLHAS